MAEELKNIDLFKNKLLEKHYLNELNKQVNMYKNSQENSIKNTSKINKYKDNLCKYYVKGLHKYIVNKFVCYGSLKYRITLKKAYDIMNYGDIVFKEFDNKQCVFKFNINKYETNIYFSQESIKKALISTRDIIRVYCECKHPLICKHAGAALLSLCDKSYTIGPIPVIKQFQVCCIVFKKNH